MQRCTRRTDCTQYEIGIESGKKIMNIISQTITEPSLAQTVSALQKVNIIAYTRRTDLLQDFSNRERSDLIGWNLCSTM